MEIRNDQYKSLETITVLALVSLAVGLLFSLKLLLHLSALFLIIGVFFKKISSVISSFWMRFAFAIGSFNSKILLSIVFFILLFPISLFYRWVKGDTLGVKRQNVSTYWKNVDRAYMPNDFEKQW